MNQLRNLFLWMIVPVTLGLAVRTVAQDDAAGSYEARPDSPASEVVIVGTIHAYHQKNARYTQEVLRDILVACEPNAILVELPATMHGKPTVEDGRLVNDFARADEGWAAQKAAEQLQVPIFPYDIDRRREVRRENGYWERRRRADERFEAWMRQDDTGEALAGLKATQRIAADIKEAILCFAEKGTPEIINSEAFDSVIRIHWRMREHVVPALMRQHPEKAELASEMQWLREQWYERNRIMVGKILERAKQSTTRAGASRSSAEPSTATSSATC